MMPGQNQLLPKGDWMEKTKEKVRGELTEEILKKPWNEQKIYRLSQELLQLKSVEEKAEVEQINQEAIADIHAKNPLPTTLYI